MKNLIAANWKMNMTNSEAIEFCDKFVDLVKDCKEDILICPPYTALSTVKSKLAKSNIALGAQDMYFEESGAFTSKISPLMLKDLKCEYVILGHSEKRHIFNETDESINKKVLAALQHKLQPILCVGETLEERESGHAQKVVQRQIKEGLNEVDMNKVTIAYEPVWAIGTGKTATPEQAEEMHAFIRSLLNEKVRILYGGSVKPENVKELMAQPNINGALVGGASLDADKFSKICMF